MWSVGGVDVESESVGSGVDVALEPKRGRRIESIIASIEITVELA